MMANALSRGQEAAGRRFVTSTTYLALLALPLVAFGAVFSTAVIHVLYGQEFLPAGPAFAFCLAATGMTTMTLAGSSLLVSADRQRSILLMVAVFAVLKVAAGALLISAFGLTGAVISFVLVAFVSAVGFMVLSIRVSRAMPEWRRLSRVALSAALAALVALPLRGQLLPWAQVVFGGLVLVGSYVPLTLLLGCWTRGDIEHLQHLHQRFISGRPRMGARFLEWAHGRAGTGGAQ